MLGACPHTHATQAGVVAARLGASSRAAETGVPCNGSRAAVATFGRACAYGALGGAVGMGCRRWGGGNDGHQASDDDADRAAVRIKPPLAGAMLRCISSGVAGAVRERAGATGY